MQTIIGGANRKAYNNEYLEHRIHSMVNNERRMRRLLDMGWDSRLCEIAREHSIDMALHKYFSHNDRLGRELDSRYKQASYICSGGGENIYCIEGINRPCIVTRAVSGVVVGREVDYDWLSEDEIAETAVHGWMNSTGHRGNILQPYWKVKGVGVAFSSDSKVYITEDFAL